MVVSVGVSLCGESKVTRRRRPDQWAACRVLSSCGSSFLDLSAQSNVPASTGGGPRGCQAAGGAPRHVSSSSPALKGEALRVAHIEMLPTLFGGCSTAKH